MGFIPLKRHRSSRKQPLQCPAQKTKQMKQNKPSHRNQQNHDNNRSPRMHGSHPGQPNRQSILAKTKKPITERLRTRIHRRPSTGLRPMRSKRHPTSKQRRAPAPFRRRRPSSPIGEQRSRGRTNRGMNHVPNAIDIRNFIGEKFNQVQRDGNPENPRMRQHLQLPRQMNHAEALKQTKRGNRSVKIQAGRESSAKRQAKSFDRIHGSSLAPSTRQVSCTGAGSLRPNLPGPKADASPNQQQKLSS